MCHVDLKKLGAQESTILICSCINMKETSIINGQCFVVKERALVCFPKLLLISEWTGHCVAGLR